MINTATAAKTTPRFLQALALAILLCSDSALSVKTLRSNQKRPIEISAKSCSTYKFLAEAAPGNFLVVLSVKNWVSKPCDVTKDFKFYTTGYMSESLCAKEGWTDERLILPTRTLYDNAYFEVPYTSFSKAIYFGLYSNCEFDLYAWVKVQRTPVKPEQESTRSPSSRAARQREEPKKKSVLQLVFWISGAIFLCICTTLWSLWRISRARGVRPKPLVEEESDEEPDQVPNEEATTQEPVEIPLQQMSDPISDKTAFLNI